MAMLEASAAMPAAQDMLYHFDRGSAGGDLHRELEVLVLQAINELRPDEARPIGGLSPRIWIPRATGSYKARFIGIRKLPPPVIALDEEE